MDIKNILIVVGSTGDANLSYHFSKNLINEYNIFFLTANKASYNFLLGFTKKVYFIDIFDKRVDDDFEINMLNFEKKYLLENNLTLNNLKFSDRNYFKINNDLFLRYGSNVSRKLETFIKNNNIDLSLSQISSSFVVRTIKYIMQGLGKKHIFIDAYPLDKNNFLISDIDESLRSSIIDRNWDNINIKNIDYKKIDDYVSAFVSKNKMIYKPIVPKFFSKKNFISLIKLIKELEVKGHSSLFNRVKTQINLIVQSKISLIGFKYARLNKKEKYIFFPIHVSDDAQILVRNQHYYNQIELIKNISRALPLNFKLYIKEHPSNIGGIGVKNLKELSKHKNIKIILPTENSQNIISNSQGVIIINGSAGLETIARKIPLVILGNTFYGKGKNVFLCRSLHDLNKAINWIINFKFYKDDFYKLFDSVLNGLFKGNYFDYYNIGKNTKNISESIKSYIKKEL